MTSSRRGYLYAFIATICGSLVYLFSKAALLEISLPQFGFWWFFFALVWNVMMALHPRGGFSIRNFQPSDYRTLGLFGVIEIIATTSLYTAIALSANPAVPSFLRNLEYLFISLLGIRFLHEKFDRKTMIGAIITLAGAFVVSLRFTDFSSVFSEAAGIMLIATTFYAFRTVLAKKHIREISPVVLSINRATYLFLFAFLFILIRKETIMIPFAAMLNIAAGAFVGPFLTSIFQYSALRYIEASRAAIIQSTTGLFVLSGAILMFGIQPTLMQISGGLITIVGVMLMMRKRK